MEFVEFKSLITTLAKKAQACAGQYRRAYESSNWQELLLVIKENSKWCYANQVATEETLSNCPENELRAANIFVRKTGVRQTESFALYYSSTSEHYGSSTSEHYGSSTSKHYDSSTSEHYDSSTSKHYGSSTSKHYGSSTSEHYDSSTSKHYGSSTSEHYGSSYGNVREFSRHSNISGNVIIRDRSSSKIYISNKKLEIVYTD